MGEMAFSHDFRMKEQAKDGINLTGLLDRSITYVHIYNSPRGRLMTVFCSVAAWLSHISWAIPFLMFLPGATDDWDNMKALGADMVKQRLSLGSNQRDLFYYLVRRYPIRLDFPT